MPPICLTVALICLSAYLLGAVPTPYIIVRLVKGADVRRHGSGNVGSSNVAGQIGKKWAALLFCFELLIKGVVPALIGQYLLNQASETDRATMAWLLLVAPILVLIGNNWSIFLRFQGGRGLAVVIGFFMAFTPALCVVAILIYLIGWGLTRSSGVWALVVLISLPLLANLPGQWITWGWAELAPLLTGLNSLPFSAGSSFVISCYCVVTLAVVVLKRLLSNTMAFPEDLSWRRTLFNRFFRDRDLDSRTEWLNRGPDMPAGEAENA